METISKLPEWYLDAFVEILKTMTAPLPPDVIQRIAREVDATLADTSRSSRLLDSDSSLLPSMSDVDQIEIIHRERGDVSRTTEGALYSYTYSNFQLTEDSGSCVTDGEILRCNATPLEGVSG